MDREYIQLCAEMAYNDVIIEEALKEEVLLEDVSSIKEKVKEFFKKIRIFITNLFNKVIGFVKECINKISKKLSKNESTSLYDQLMEMVLKEGVDYGVIAVIIYEDYINAFSDIYVDLEKIDTMFNENVFSSHELIDLRINNDKEGIQDYYKKLRDRIDTHFNDINELFDEEEIDKIEEKCKKEIADHKEKAGFGKDHKADDHLIRYFHRNLDIQSENLRSEINMLEKREKEYNKKIEEAEKEESDAFFTYYKEYYNTEVYYYNKRIKALSRLEKGYIDLLRCITQIAQKSKIENLKQKNPDGTISYRI